MKSIAHKPRTFEERIDAQRARILAANRHRVFECTGCGKRYAYDWVYEYGMRCDDECDMELVEVAHA